MLCVQLLIALSIVQYEILGLVSIMCHQISQYSV